MIGQREKQRTKDTQRRGERERARGREGEERRRVGGTQYRHSLVNPFAVFRHCSSLPNLGPSPAHLARLWTIASPFSHFGPSPAIVALQLFLLTPRQQPPRWRLGPRLYQILLLDLTFSQTLDLSWDLDYFTSSSRVSSHVPSQTLDLSWDLDYFTSSSRVALLARLWNSLGTSTISQPSSRVSLLARLWTSLRTSIIASPPGSPFPFLSFPIPLECQNCWSLFPF